jgi:hypothetical protein
MAGNGMGVSPMRPRLSARDTGVEISGVGRGGDTTCRLGVHGVVGCRQTSTGVTDATRAIGCKIVSVVDRGFSLK